jgi:hypothetical protein
MQAAQWLAGSKLEAQRCKATVILSGLTVPTTFLLAFLLVFVGTAEPDTVIKSRLLQGPK